VHRYERNPSRRRIPAPSRATSGTPKIVDMKYFLVRVHGQQIAAQGYRGNGHWWCMAKNKR
jgi:hypothetical protein